MDPLQQLYPSRGARQIGQVLGDIASGNIGTPGMREKVLGEVYDNEYKLQRAREQRGAAILSLLNITASFYSIMPLMAVLAGIALFLSLSRSSELVAIRASGRWRATRFTTKTGGRGLTNCGCGLGWSILRT